MSDSYWRFTPLAYHVLDNLSKSYFFSNFAFSAEISLVTGIVRNHTPRLRCAKPASCFLVSCFPSFSFVNPVSPADKACFKSACLPLVPLLRVAGPDVSRLHLGRPQDSARFLRRGPPRKIHRLNNRHILRILPAAPAVFNQMRSAPGAKIPGLQIFLRPLFPRAYLKNRVPPPRFFRIECASPSNYRRTYNRH